MNIDVKLKVYRSKMAHLLQLKNVQKMLHFLVQPPPTVNQNVGSGGLITQISYFFEFFQKCLKIKTKM